MVVTNCFATSEIIVDVGEREQLLDNTVLAMQNMIDQKKTERKMIKVAEGCLQFSLKHMVEKLRLRERRTILLRNNFLTEESGL